jgi:hypothetical protein
MKSTTSVDPRTRAAAKPALAKLRRPASTRVRPPVPEAFARFLLNRHRHTD